MARGDDHEILPLTADIVRLLSDHGWTIVGFILAMALVGFFINLLSGTYG